MTCEYFLHVLLMLVSLLRCLQTFCQLILIYCRFCTKIKLFRFVFHSFVTILLGYLT